MSEKGKRQHIRWNLSTYKYSIAHRLCNNTSPFNDEEYVSSSGILFAFNAMIYMSPVGESNFGTSFNNRSITSRPDAPPAQQRDCK